jgi:uncharacterized protein (TIGR03118 family)
VGGPHAAAQEEQMSRLWTSFPVQRNAALALALAALPAAALAQHYKQTNLIADQASISAAQSPDGRLKNPWGMSRSSGSPWWISDNGTGKSTLYDGTGAVQSLVVTIPPADAANGTGTPTGTIFNGTTDFTLATSKPAAFLFATEDGTVSGWNPGVQPTTAVIKVNTHSKSVFKGMTMATATLTSGPANLLYVADFRKGLVQVYDTNFQPVHVGEDAFQDEELPTGFAPFNIQNIGGDLFVAFAEQDAAKHDEVDGAGLGYVDVFSPSGRLLRRFEHGSWFNAPWGLALASSDFGIFSHDLLVGQFGSGEILAFDPVTGKFKGRLVDQNNQPIVNEGLWGLSFGNDGTAGPETTLYLTVGVNHEADGLLGSITAVENPQGNDQ